MKSFIKSWCANAQLMFSVAFLMAACSSHQGSDTIQTAQESPEIKDSVIEEIKYVFENKEQKFTVNNSKGKEIPLPSGSLIKIPAGCFVDSLGNPIAGNVQIFYEEFLTPGSIIASGIVMKYGAEGKNEDFESAGMFRINATKDNKDVYIAKGKTLDVKLATNDSGQNFNLYYSGAGNGSDWSFQQSSQATRSATQTRTAQTVVPSGPLVNPIPPAAYSAEGKYFDLNLSSVHSKDLKSLVGVVWEYAGKNPKQDPANSPEVFNRKWDFVSILPSEGAKRGIYKIVLQNNDTTIKTIARPVFRGAVLDAENELFAKELGEFNKRMEAASESEKQELAESAFSRLVQIKQMGLYNCDRFYEFQDKTEILASFDFGDEALREKPISVFLVTGNGMAVIKYMNHPNFDVNFTYSPGERNKLIAILPDQEICTFSSSRFKSEIPKSGKNNDRKFTFKLNRTGVKARQADDVDQILESI